MNARAALAVLLFATAWPAAVVAKEPSSAELAQARELFSLAEKDESSGAWAAALEKLERAVRIKATPGLRFHVALCLESLGRLTEALEGYEGAARAAQAENVAEVLEATKAPLEDLRARVPSLSVALVGVTAAEVDVTLDAAPIDTTTPLRLAPGRHRLTARRKVGDGSLFIKQVDLREREAVTVEVKLPKDELTSTPALSAPPGPRGFGTAALAAAAGAVVVAGAGVGAFLVAGNAQDELADCKTVASCEDTRDRVRTWDTVALSGFAVGAALGITAGLFRWMTPAKRSTALPATLRVRF